MQRHVNQVQLQKEVDPEVLEKRRLQNRRSQRKHRSSVKSQIDTLKAQNKELQEFKEAALQKQNLTVFSNTNCHENETSSVLTALARHFDEESSPMIGPTNDEADPLIAYPELLVRTGELPHLALGLCNNSTVSYDDSSAENAFDMASTVAHPEPSIDLNSPIDHAADTFDMSTGEKQYPPGCANSHRSLLRPGRTPLHHAVANSHQTVVQVLLRFKADIDIADEEGKTPLHECAIKGNADLARFLLDNGAHPEVLDCEGLTPLQHAAALGHAATVEVLLQYGADINGSLRTPVSSIGMDL